MKKILLLLLLFVLLVGCYSKQEYAKSRSMRLNTAETITVSDIETSAADLIERMLSDAAFKDRILLNNNEKPLLQIDRISIFSNRRFTLSELDTIRENLTKKLRKTGLFEITADTDPRELASKISRDSKINEMDIAFQQAFDSRQPADYLLRGTYRCFRNGDMYSHVLSLQLIDVKKSLIVWSDIAEIAKQ